MPLRIAVDGPVGAGKSTIADEVSRRLGILHLDTGAMYRAVGLTAMERGVDLEDEEAVSRLCRSICVSVEQQEDGQHTLVDGVDKTALLRAEKISMAASKVSTYSAVRAEMVRAQQRIAGSASMLLDGRDIGTRVLPDADVKIFLTASAEERARRRLKQLQEKGDAPAFEVVLEDLRRRDWQDSHREHDPLRQAEDAVLVDTTHLDFEQSVEKILAVIREKTEGTDAMHDKPMSALDYARAACDTMMRRYAAADLPPKGHFHYHQGVFLSGVLNTWQLTGNRAYFDYAKDWIDSVFNEDGSIKDCVWSDLDDIQPGILLFPILDETGDEKYLRFLRTVYAEVKDIPQTPEGGNWHKKTLKNQMWLDGLYMAGPFCAEYAERFHLPELSENVVRQVRLVFRHTKDEATGLLRHAWDMDRAEPWADPVTGKAPEFWGRAMGWVPVAILDDMDHLPEGSEGWEELRANAVELLESLRRYQSEDGRWYQVVDKGSDPANWLENSCSCLYVAAMAKAVRKGFLPDSFRESIRRGYEGVIRSLTWEGDDVQVGNVCIGTGVGDYEFYLKRPVHANDLHGMGAFLLMCCEVARLEEMGK